MITADRKKLIDKIAKLLALADSSDFSEEAQTAKNLAAELLARHDIAACEIKSEPFETDHEAAARFTNYDGCLLTALARINSVAVIRFTGGFDQPSARWWRRVIRSLASHRTSKRSDTCAKL